ncbi:hypothetical protein CMV30_13855 [Nibricoccus aquaticus]|uniref:Uncharacterized protein n=1 Tax=Nibricoccus aquaticus TaxID=2576891 RepID=A0A290QLP5_9BACT|nr:hypothetical protein [Nibricoccus aquaticus]ATC64962.1 hypothetical protein CMV30_13855 [Nibricoccus aquaticus]
MHLLWHIVKKDLRRLWPWLALLVGATLARYANFYAPGFDPERTRLAELWNRAELIDNLFLGLSLFATALIAAALVHQDPVIGDRSFWLTRPISGRRLLASKFITFTITLLVIPFAVQVGWWLAQHYRIADITTQFPPMAGRQAGVAFAAFCFALLTRNVGSFILTALITTLALTAAHAILIDQWLKLPSRAGEYTRERLELIVALIVLPVLIVHQYFTRNTRRTLVFAGGLVALCLGLYAAWSLPLFKEITSLPTLATNPAVSASASLPISDFHRQRISGASRVQPRTKNIPALSSELTLGPIPAGHVVQIVGSRFSQKLPLILHERHVPLSQPQHPESYASTDKLLIFDRNYETPPEIPGSFEVAFMFALRRPETVVTLPIVTGAAGSRGPYHVRIAATRSFTSSIYGSPDGTNGSEEAATASQRFALTLDEITPSYLLSHDDSYAEYDSDGPYHINSSDLYRNDTTSRRAYFLVSRSNGSLLTAESMYIDATLSVDGVRRRLIRVVFPKNISESELADYDLVKVIAPLVGTFTRSITFPATRWTEPAVSSRETP